MGLRDRHADQFPRVASLERQQQIWVEQAIARGERDEDIALSLGVRLIQVMAVRDWLDRVNQQES